MCFPTLGGGQKNRSPRRPLRRNCLRMALRRLGCVCALFLAPAATAGQAQTNPLRLENTCLRIDLSPAADASLTVLDKRDNLIWRQEVRPGYRANSESLRVTPGSINCRITSASGKLNLTISLSAGTDSS